MTTPAKPTPGTRDAHKLGCTCPTMDNNYGRGAYTDSNGERQFWISGDCPVHVLKERR